MNDLIAFDDVLASDIQVNNISIIEFEFDNGAWCLQREHQWHRWEIQFEDAEGEQGITIEREDFSDGKFEFDIDGQAASLTLAEFDRIEKFAYEKGLIN